MKVWLISGKNPSDGRILGRECVVLEKPAASDKYHAEEFTLVGSKEQKEALNAQAEFEKLSEAARRKLGITFRHVAKLKRLAEPDLDIKAGDTIYVSTSRLFPSKVTGIYTWWRSYLDESCTPAHLYANVGTYFRKKNARAVAQEVEGFSASTRRLMGLKV